MGNPATVPMLAPDGTPGDIPHARVQDAVKAGFKLGTELTAPNGQVGIVPMDRVHDAINAGFVLKGASAGSAKPRDPLEGVAGYDALGPIPDNLSTRIGRRIKGNLDVPAQLQGAASAVSAGLKNIKEGGPSQLPAFLDAFKQYKKPENVIGDAVSAYVAGGASDVPTVRAAEPPPWWRSTAETPKPPYKTSPALALAKHLPFLGKYAYAADILQKAYGRLTAEPPATPPGPTGPPEMWGQSIPDRPSPPVEHAPVSKTAINQTLDRSLTEAVGNKPIQPGVPLRNQGSAALKSFRYDPAAQELHVTTHDGTTYISGEVTPDQAQAFRSAPSKGQAWQTIRDNSPLVAKVPSGGQRISAKGAQRYKSASPTDQPPSNDLTDILTRSLRATRK
jgi:KTSC domain-containing protein